MSSTGTRSRRRWPAVALAVVGVVVAVPVVAGAVFVWSFSGGWDGIRPKAQPTDGEVVGAREDSAERTRSVHDETVSRVLEISGGTVLAATEVDTCREGMNDWKNHDGYTLSCSRTAATAIQLPDQASVEGTARAVDEAVLPDPVFADWSDARGTGADVEAAFEAAPGVRLLVVNEVTYFED